MNEPTHLRCGSGCPSTVTGRGPTHNPKPTTVRGKRRLMSLSNAAQQQRTAAWDRPRKPLKTTCGPSTRAA